MRILTWNINSVRLRLPLLLKLMKGSQADIIALQETKCPDEFFPLEEIHKAGYKHTYIHGMKSYNGVAVLSRVPFFAQEIHHRCGKEDCRHIAVTINLSSLRKQGSGKYGQPDSGLRRNDIDTIELHNLYIPAGGDEPDPVINLKYKHKLDFVDEMTNWFKKNYKSDARLIALGDFNIAPQEHDVWSHKQLKNVVSHTEPEITRLVKMQRSLDWVDTARYFIPPEEKVYTWWSYRNHDWRKSNRGRRLDHIWVTQPLLKSLKSHDIMVDARDWAQPSDHVPVMIDLNLKA